MNRVQVKAVFLTIGAIAAAWGAWYLYKKYRAKDFDFDGKYKEKLRASDEYKQVMQQVNTNFPDEKQVYDKLPAVMVLTQDDIYKSNQVAGQPMMPFSYSNSMQQYVPQIFFQWKDRLINHSKGTITDDYPPVPFLVLQDKYDSTGFSTAEIRQAASKCEAYVQMCDILGTKCQQPSCGTAASPYYYVIFKRK